MCIVIVGGMAKAYVLDRVATDLARGYTHPAIQRLGSLVAAHPTDLDLRHRLALAHRRVGNRIQAGRWDYLTVGAETCETVAFERAYPSPLARLRRIHWPQRASAAATDHARSKLAELFAAVEKERDTGPAGAPLPARRARSAPARQGRVAQSTDRLWQWLRRRWWRIGLIGFAGLVTGSLAMIGAATVFQWIIP